MSALLEYAVFGERIAVTEADGAYIARLDSDPAEVWGKGASPLAALGDCVLRWSTLEGMQPDEAPEEDDVTDSGGPAVRTYQSVQPRLTLPARKTPPRRKTARPSETVSYPQQTEERVVFGQRVRVTRQGRERYVAQIEGRGRMWWGHGATAHEALSDCVLNWAGPLIRIPDQLEGLQAEFSVLEQLFQVSASGEGYVAQMVRTPAVQARGASPREALAACIMRWSDLQTAAAANTSF